MIKGNYCTYVLADIRPIGWKEVARNVRKYYCCFLFARKVHKSGKIERCIVTAPMECPRDASDRNLNCQFQRIIRLLNNDEPVKGPLDFKHFIGSLSEILRKNNFNFCIRWKDQRSKYKKISEIAWSSSEEFKSLDFEWPDRWGEIGQPINKKVSVLPKKLIKKVVLKKPIDVSDDSKLLDFHKTYGESKLKSKHRPISDSEEDSLGDMIGRL